MPIENANPDNSKNGAAVTSTPLPELNDNVVDDSAQDLESTPSPDLDPSDILDDAESGDLVRSVLTKDKQLNPFAKNKKDETKQDKSPENKDVTDPKDKPENKEDLETDKETEQKDKEEETPDPEVEVDKSLETKDKKEIPKGERDYSDFTPEEVQWLKKCDNRAFNVLSNKIKEFKTSYQKAEKERNNLHKIIHEKAIPIEYYQHPDAYTLTDEYKELATDFSFVQREREHFRAQLLKIRKGEQWVDLTNWKKDGTPVYSEPKEPTEEAALNLQERITEASTLQGQIQGQVRALATHFKTNHENSNKTVVNAVEGYIAKLHEGFKPEQRHIDAAMENLKALGKGNDPLAMCVAKCYGVIAKLAMALENKKAQNNTDKLKQNDDKEAGVRTSNLPKTSSNRNGNNGRTINFGGKQIPIEYDPESFKAKNDED